MKHKVLAYLLRQNLTTTELLVCEHMEENGGTEVPRGTVDPGETHEEALRRELVEEAGIREIRDLRPLSALTTEKSADEEWHYYAGWLAPDSPDTWEHTVTGNGEVRGTHFRYHWIPLPLEIKLANDTGEGLPAVLSYIAQTSQPPTRGQNPRP